MIRKFLFPFVISLASFACIVASLPSSAQIVNPAQPATGVPVAGTGISVAGQTVSINYGLGSQTYTGTINANALGSNTVTQTAATLQTATVALSATTSAQTLDTFPIATFRACKYVVTITQGTNYQVGELLALHDGTNTFTQMYALASSTGSQFATYSTTVTGGNLVLSVTFASGATAGSAKVQAIRVIL